jgi:hypothetical protein
MLMSQEALHILPKRSASGWRCSSSPSLQRCNAEVIAA